MSDNGSEFKQYFTTFLKDTDIKPVSTTIKKLANSPAEKFHQVIFNMLVTKDIYNKVFDYIDPWGKTLVPIAWEIRDYYHCTIGTTPEKYVFGRDMIFNLTSVVDCRVITAKKQCQFEIDNICKNAKQFRFDYAVGYIVYVGITCIYQKLDNKKVTYRIT